MLYQIKQLYREPLLRWKAMISNGSNTKAQYRICESLYHLRRLEEANERVIAFLTADPDNNELNKIRNKIRELLLNDRWIWNEVYHMIDFS